MILTIIAKILLAVVPGSLLLAYIYHKDPHKEPDSALTFAFLSGILVAVLAVGIELGIKYSLFGTGDYTTLLGAVLMAFLVAALPEEGLKLIYLTKAVKHEKVKPHFDEHFDGIVYAVFVGMGFAIVENILYVLPEENWLMTGLARAFLSVPAHYAFAIIMGYYFSLYHFVDHSRKNAFLMFFLPFLLHGCYDTLVMSVKINPTLGGIAFLVLIVFCVKMHQQANRRIRNLIDLDRQKEQELNNLTSRSDILTI